MGSHTVVLNIIDSKGLTDTGSKSITFAAPDFPWLWVGIVAGVICFVVVVVIVVALRRRE